MKNIYKPITLEQHLGYLVEEAGEVQAAAGKTLRWGLDSANPELRKSQCETNAHWLLREMSDLENAIKLMRVKLADHGWEA